MILIPPFSSRLTLCWEVVLTGAVVLLMFSGASAQKQKLEEQHEDPTQITQNSSLCLLTILLPFAIHSFFRHVHAFMGFSVVSAIWVLAQLSIRKVTSGSRSWRCIWLQQHSRDSESRIHFSLFWSLDWSGKDGLGLGIILPPCSPDQSPWNFLYLFYITSRAYANWLKRCLKYK